jgi:KDO2-lipid IV(A) lauroyltransferase
VSVDALNRSMEVLITRHPTHYHWAYKRFKLTPTLPDYYHIDADAAQQLSRRTDRATDADTHSV